MGRRRRDREEEQFGPDDDTPSGPSKSQVKRDMTELQALGEQLTRLADTQLAAIPLDDGMRDALAELKRIKSFEARRRQVQYIGKLMRDADVDAIRLALAELRRRTP
ncbi:MAG TPA: ribosome biogenesis factor YjgA [Nevskiaceae bacterium]|nr:ribosome biogenesis factor YjgA [Nevskiaceae bacterium]